MADTHDDDAAGKRIERARMTDRLHAERPRHRIDDVVIFDPSDPKYAPSFNPMDPIKPELKLRVALSFLDAFKRSFGADWSERMDHVLRYAMLGL